MSAMRAWLQSSVPVFLAITLSACPLNLDTGNNGGDGGTPKDGMNQPSGDAGVATNRDPRTLSTDEARQLCESVSGAPTPDVLCRIAAIKASSTPEMCQALVADCMKQSVPPPSDNECKGTDVQMSLSTCTGVTVADVKSCFLQVFALEQQRTSADVGKPYVAPDCLKNLASHCPDLVGKGPEGEGPITMGPPSNGYPGSPGGPDDSDGGVSYEPVGECNPPSLAPSAPSVDCSVFCGAIVEPHCSSGPSLDSCRFACEGSKQKCPGTIVALAKCAYGKHWVCDVSGRPHVDGGCGAELGCFVGCAGSAPMMEPPPPQPQQ